MNYTGRHCCSRRELTAEEKELKEIEYQMKALEERKKKILMKKDKNYAKSLVDMAANIEVSEVNGNVVIILK